MVNTLIATKIRFNSITCCPNNCIFINQAVYSDDDDDEDVKPGTHHAIFVFCWTQRRRKDDRRMVCAHQRRSSSVDFTDATVVGPIRKTNRSNNCCMVCAGQRHPSHQPTDHRPITVKHLRDASTSDLRFGHNIIYI